MAKNKKTCLRRKVIQLKIYTLFSAQGVAAAVRDGNERLHYEGSGVQYNSFLEGSMQSS